MCDAISVFRNFGGFGGFKFSFGDEEEEEAVRKGDDVYMRLEISLKDAFVGKDIEVWPTQFMHKSDQECC